MKRRRSRIIVELDDVASKFLRDYMVSGNHPTIEDGEDPRTVVSAAVCWLMGEDCCTDDVLEAARARRLALEEGRKR